MTRKNCIYRRSAPPGGPFDLSPSAHWLVPGTLRCIHFSPDSRSVAVSHWFQSSPDKPEEHFVWLIEVPGLERKVSIPVPHAKQLAFLPDGQHLGLATTAGLTLWDLKNKRIVWEVPQIDISMLAFSPDGRIVATGGDDRLVILRNSADGSVRFRLAGHRGRIRHLAFSLDNRTFVSSDENAVVKFWSISAGREMLAIGPLNQHGGNLEFSADGSQFLWSNGHAKGNESLIFDGSRDEQ